MDQINKKCEFFLKEEAKRLEGNRKKLTVPVEMKLNTNRTRPNRLRDPKLN